MRARPAMMATTFRRWIAIGSIGHGQALVRSGTTTLLSISALVGHELMIVAGVIAIA